MIGNYSVEIRQRLTMVWGWESSFTLWAVLRWNPKGRLMNVSELFHRLTKVARKQYRRRSKQSSGRPAAAEVLEDRALLTLGVNFDFTVIASDLSSDLRLFGSSDPSDAPLEVIRYGSGTVTGLEGFDGGRPLGNPGDLTFQFGSMDVNNPVSVMQLDRSTFDGGVTDGIANQNYLPVQSGRNMQFFHAGTLFAEASILELNLEVTPEGVTTGTGRFGPLLQAETFFNGDFHQVRDLFNNTFSENANNDVTRGREFTLSPFNFDGKWTGVADAEIFESSGMMVSGDDAPDRHLFTVPWDTASPFFGTATHQNDNDHLRVDLDPNMEHTFRVSSSGDARLIDFFGDFLTVSAESNYDGRLLNDANTTIVTMQPRSPLTTINLSHNDGTWRIDLIDSQPASLNVYFVDEQEIGWSPAYDGDGNVLPADGYRVEISNRDDGIFHQMDVDASTFRYSMDGLLGMDDQKVRVGRIVDGQVTAFSEYRNMRAIKTRANFTGFDGRTLTWDAIPGVQRYELVLNDINTRILTTETSYTFPADHPIGWRQAWVRGVRSTFYGDWSFPRNYHVRSKMGTPTVNVDNPARPVINWETLPGAARYELLLRNQTTGESMAVHETELTGNSWTPDADLGLGQYFGWMRGISDANIAAAWSERFTFSVTPLPVSTTGSASEVTFNWNSPAGIGTTELYIKNGSTVIQRDGLTGNSWTETHNFATGNVTWWVRGFDSNGTATRWSQSATVRVGSSVITKSPQELVPAASVTSLAWLPVLGAESYEVFLRGHGEADTVTNVGQNTTFNVGLTGGRYSVWINALFAGGTNRYSRPAHFDVETNFKRVFVTESGLAPNPPTVAWLPSADGHATRLWFRNTDDNSNFQVFFAPGESYTLPAALPAATYRIWAAPANTLTWGRPITIILAQAESLESEDAPETLMVALELSSLMADDKSVESAPKVPVPDEQDVPANEQNEARASDKSTFQSETLPPVVQET